MPDGLANKSGSVAAMLVKLLIVVVLLVTAAIILQSKGYDVTAPFSDAYSYYFGHRQTAEQARQPVAVHLPVTPPAEIAEVLPDAELMAHEPAPGLPAIPRIALHPFVYSQYREQRNDGSEVSQLIVSLLMIELSKSDNFDLLDRSLVPTILSEKSQLLGASGYDSSQASIDKLPLSDFTLTGVLFSSQHGRSFSLKLIRNNTGQIVGARRYSFDMDNVQKTAAQAVSFVTGLIDQVGKQDDIDNAKRIAFGHFVNLDGNSDLSRGREITEGLIDRFINDSGLSVLERTQVFPLLFEENLRTLQYTDEYQASERPHSDYFVYGKYRLGHGGSEKPITIYLYIDLVKSGRKFVILHADDWDNAERAIADTVREYLSQPQQLLAEVDNYGKFNVWGIIEPDAFADAFNGVVTSHNTSEVFQALINEGYFEHSHDYVSLNLSHQLDLILNYPHTGTLANFNQEESAAIFERLRSYVFRPGLYAKYLHPKRRYNLNRINETKRSWRQVERTRDYDAEATLQFDIASAICGMHIIKASTIPSVDFYPKVQRESDERRRTNLEMAIDGFASAAYLDPAFLDAMVLLGYGLCDKLIGRRPSGNMIHAWVVDHTKKANLKSVGGIYFNVTEDVEEKDKLIFLSADAIDRVDDAGLTDMFLGSLMCDEYIVSKHESKLKRIVGEIGEPSSDSDFERLVYAYAGMVQAKCVQLTQWPRSLGNMRKYTSAMEPLAVLALSNEKAAALRSKLLRDIELHYPAAYPYLLIRMETVAPFVAKEQDDMVARVSSRSVIPIEIADFMKDALKLFERRVKSGDIAAAKRYVQYFSDFFGMDADTAMDFAYLYRRVGDIAQSERLLKENGKNSFEVSGFDLEQVNGTYRSEGLNEKGHIKFSNSTKPEIYFVYRANPIHFGMGEKAHRWSLYIDSARPYHGNTKPDKVWPDATVASKGSDDEQKVDMGSVVVIELEALTKEGLALPENTIEWLAGGNTFVDYHNKVAIKAYPNKETEGPLLDEYFPESLTKTRRAGVVKEVLFRKGYISVTGLPLFDKKNPLRSRLKKDFPDYSAKELGGIGMALEATRKLEGAGYVEMYDSADGRWHRTTTLIPDDAIAERYFGRAAAVYGDQALVCDCKDGIYNFKRVGGEWRQQYRFESRCNNVAMNERWAAVRESEKVLVYRYDNGKWQKDQTLQPDHYLENKSLDHNFEYFGDAIAVWKDTIFVGNPYGGKNNRGQLYIYSNHGGKWKQTHKLQSYQSSSAFGRSIAVTDPYLFVGNPSDGEPDSRDGKIQSPTWRTGAVLVYQNTGSDWIPKAKLIVKGRPRLAEFGLKVRLQQDKDWQVVMTSRKKLYRINHADLIARLEQSAEAH